MMKIRLLIFFIWGFSYTLFSQSVGVSISPVLFEVDSQANLELNFQYYGNSLKVDSFLAAREPAARAAVEVTTLFKQDQKIAKYDRYKINFPIKEDQKEFLDIRRYRLQPGTYNLEIDFVDHYNPDSRYTHTEVIQIPEIDLTKAKISGVKLLARLEPLSSEDSDTSFLHNGVIMEPLPHQFYNPRLNTLNYYLEFYRLPSLGLDNYVFRSEIFSLKKGEWNEVLTTYQKLSPSNAIEPLAKKLDISSLPSDTYKLKVSLIDGSKKEWLSRSVVFVQSNPQMDADMQEKLLSGEIDNFFDTLPEEDLLYSLRAVAMKLGGKGQKTVNNLVRKKDYESMRDFLFRYWIKKIQYSQSWPIANLCA
ncbi:MAG: hypothetical protein GVX78_01005 [Bacteroidetes bacterium]|jgi:hypothetical protein|nr:hypothetical protein [Bacteroidota bacterium]